MKQNWKYILQIGQCTLYVLQTLYFNLCGSELLSSQLFKTCTNWVPANNCKKPLPLSTEKTQNTSVNIFAPPPVTPAQDNPNHALLLSSCQIFAWLPRSPSPPPQSLNFSTLQLCPCPPGETRLRVCKTLRLCLCLMTSRGEKAWHHVNSCLAASPAAMLHQHQHQNDSKIKSTILLDGISLQLPMKYGLEHCPANLCLQANPC